MKLSTAVLTGFAFLLANALCAQIQYGIKLGTNFLVASQSITPSPKDSPPSPKGLGLQFGGYAKIPFSDMVGLRPELGFSFRRAKVDQTVTENLPVTDQNGAQIGSVDVTSETKLDQKLQYFEIAAPLTFNPNPSFRLMLGPAISFLMGGKVTEDDTETFSNGTANNQPFTHDPIFNSTTKTGDAATKYYTTAEVALVVGGGYQLGMGLDLDLRYYRAIVATQEITDPTYHYKAFTNMIEFSIGYTFGMSHS